MEFLTGLWRDPYFFIFQSNALIEGLSDSEVVTSELRDQLIGEALFVRAYSHFYLTNLFGPIPYSNSTNVEQNNSASRLPEDEIYSAIIEDLLSAQTLLPEDFSSIPNGERVRPTKGAATALLARVYIRTVFLLLRKNCVHRNTQFVSG